MGALRPLRLQGCPPCLYRLVGLQGGFLGLSVGFSVGLSYFFIRLGLCNPGFLLRIGKLPQQRRMMEIMECEILPGGERRYNTLFRYVITENHMENGKFIIEGHHAQINEISASLRKRLLENGMPNEELQALLNPKKEVNAN